jgi:hypothetical protein
MRAGMGQQTDESSSVVPSTPLYYEERVLGRPMPLSVRSRGGSSNSPGKRNRATGQACGYIKSKTSQFLGVGSSSSQQGIWDRPLAPMLLSLVEMYANSNIAVATKSDLAPALGMW